MRKLIFAITILIGYSYSFGQQISCSVSSVPACPGSLITVSYNVTGTSLFGGNIFSVYLSDINGNFNSIGTGIQIGSLQNSMMLTGSINCTLPTNIQGGTNYKVKVSSSRPTISGTPSSAFTVLQSPSAIISASSSSEHYNNFSSSQISAFFANTPITFTANSLNATDFSWSFPTGNPSNSNGLETSGIIFQEGEHSSSLIMNASNGCTSTYAFTTKAVSCNPQLSLNTQFITNNTTFSLGLSDASLHVCNNATLTLTYPGTLQNGIYRRLSIYLEPGSTLVFGNASAHMMLSTIYAKSGSTINATQVPSNLTYSQNNNILVLESGVNIIGSSLAESFSCSSLTFNTANFPCGTSCNQGTTGTLSLSSSQYVLCGNDPVTLTASPNFNAQNYKVYLNNNLISSSNSPIITANQPGDYYVVGSIGSCSITSNTINISMATQPSIVNNGSSIVCPNETTTLSTDASGTYFWNTGETTPNITPTSQNGNSYFVTQIHGNCTLQSPVITVYVSSAQQPVISGPSSVCAGSSVNLTSTSGNYPLAWNNGETGNTISATGGIYNVSYNDEYGCLVQSDNFLLNVTPLPTFNVTSSAGNSFCSGQSTTLSVNSTEPTILWNTGDQGQTIMVNSGGTYSATVITADGCENSESITIIEKTIPQQPVITSTIGNPVCPGNTEVLISSYTSGNFWSSGEISSSISPVSDGVFTVSYTDPISGCTSLPSLPYTVDYSDVIAEIINGSSINICSGNPVQLNAAQCNNCQYQWKKGNNVIGTSPSISVNATGTYTLSVTQASCVATSISVLNMAQSPATPIIQPGGQITVCEGSTATLSTNSSAGNYQWLINGSPVSGATSSIFILPSTLPVGSHQVTVTVTNSAGCSKTSSAKTITVQNPNAVAISAMITLTAGPGNTYLWNTGATTQTIQVPLSEAEYSVTVTDQFGCSYTSCITVNNSGTCSTSLRKNENVSEEINNIKATHQESILTKVIPNPNNGQFKVEVDSKEEGAALCQIFDSTGKLIMNKTFHIEEGTQQIDIESKNMSTGLYHLLITVSGETSKHKIIIQN